MARHGLRVTEAVGLRWDQVDVAKGHLHVRRLKNGIDSVHTVQGDEIRALRQLRRDQEPLSAFVFTSERGGPMTRSNGRQDDRGRRRSSRTTAHASARVAPYMRASLSRCRP